MTPRSQRNRHGVTVGIDADPNVSVVSLLGEQIEWSWIREIHPSPLSRQLRELAGA